MFESSAELCMLLDLPSDAPPGALVKAIVDLQLDPTATEENAAEVERRLYAAEVGALIECGRLFGVHRLPQRFEVDRHVDEYEPRLEQAAAAATPAAVVEAEWAYWRHVDARDIRAGLKTALAERKTVDQITHGWVVSHSACMALLHTLRILAPDAVLVVVPGHRFTLDELSAHLDYDPRDYRARMRPGPALPEIVQGLRALICAAAQRPVTAPDLAAAEPAGRAA